MALNLAVWGALLALNLGGLGCAVGSTWLVWGAPLALNLQASRREALESDD